MEERAILDPGNGVELVVEVGERAALACDVHQVRHASMQQETLRTSHLQDVRKKRRLLDVPASCPAAVGFELERNAAPQSPLGGMRRASNRDLTSLGRAVDLHQSRVEASFGLHGKLLCERCG